MVQMGQTGNRRTAWPGLRTTNQNQDGFGHEQVGERTSENLPLSIRATNLLLLHNLEAAHVCVSMEELPVAPWCINVVKSCCGQELPPLHTPVQV